MMMIMMMMMIIRTLVKERDNKSAHLRGRAYKLEATIATIISSLFSNPP